MKDGSITCKSCSATNREIAAYCKSCGSPLPEAHGLTAGPVVGFILAILSFLTLLVLGAWAPTESRWSSDERDILIAFSIIGGGIHLVSFIVLLVSLVRVAGLKIRRGKSLCVVGLTLLTISLLVGYFCVMAALVDQAGMLYYR
jgi:hypothetical protein